MHRLRMRVLHTLMQHPGCSHADLDARQQRGSDSRWGETMADAGRGQRPQLVPRQLEGGGCQRVFPAQTSGKDARVVGAQGNGVVRRPQLRKVMAPVSAFICLDSAAAQEHGQLVGHTGDGGKATHP
jgi:hypothetical protein